MDLELQYLDARHGRQITSLREIAYRRFYGEMADPSAIRFNGKLEHTLNLGILSRADHELKSAYRIDIISDRQKLHGLMQTSQRAGAETAWGAVEKIVLPTVVGGRACTHPDWQNRGLHWILRL